LPFFKHTFRQLGVIVNVFSFLVVKEEGLKIAAYWTRQERRIGLWSKD
jgi:hypothetical protein